MALAGVGVIVLGALPLQRADGQGGTNRLVMYWHNLPVGQKRLIVAGLVAGVVVLAVTRWVPAVVIVPVVVVAGPRLLGDPKNRDIIVLEALDRWVRALTASLLTGRSVPDAIRSTRRQAPEVLANAVSLAALRLDERWTLPDALAGFADDVNHADADAVAAALVVAGQRGTGAAATLEALADALQDRLAAAREIDNERAKPRIVVRQVTAIIGVVLVLALITSPAYFAPYRSGVGPWIAVGLALVYVASLARLQAASQPKPRGRLRQATKAPVPQESGAER